MAAAPTDTFAHDLHCAAACRTLDVPANQEATMNRFHVQSALFAGILLTLSGGSVRAGEVILPPLAAPAVVQTNGPQGLLSHGDWWSNSAGGNQPHCYYLYVPDAVPGTYAIQVALFDPECYQTNGELDERKGASWDTAHFQLIAPDGTTVVADQTFAPAAGSSNVWNTFAQFTAGQFGHGVYQILASVSGDDENTYRIKIVENNPDGVDNSGDEMNLAIGRSALQMISLQTAALHLYVPPDATGLRLANFGMDANRAIWYTSPAGDSLTGTLSGDATWNNTTSTTLPPPGGDLITTPLTGWWTIHFTAAVNNQFSFYVPGALFMGETGTSPQLAATLQNSRTQVRKGELVTYTATLRNTGTGPAQACSLAVTFSPGLVVTDPGAGRLTTAGIWLYTLPLLLPGAALTQNFTVFISSETTSPVNATAVATGEDLLFQPWRSAPAIDIDQLLVSGSISGLIWQDSNHDGRHDTGEPGMAGMKIDLLGPSQNVLVSDTSSASGAYQFLGLPIGTYQVRPDAAFLPEGWDATTTVQGEWLSVTDLGENHTDVDLGYNNFETPVEMSSFTAMVHGSVVELRWSTQSETDNMGFHLYRSTAAEGPWERITRTMVPGAGSSQSARSYSFSDALPAAGGSYYFRISDVDYAGVETIHSTIEVTVAAAPGEFRLEQNYPNPFNSSTVISFAMQKSGAVRIVIHNLLGQVVRVLADEVREAGEHRLMWDGRDERGIAVPAGVYLCTMQVEQFRTTRKLQYIR